MKEINLNEKLASFSEYWSPKTITNFNGHDVMVVKVKGEFNWHSHPDTDDFFLVVKGRAALEAEKLGIVDGPLQPSVHVGHDFRAGDPPQDWDVKGYDSERPFDAESALDKIEERDLPNDENILFDTTNMTEEDIVELETELESRPNFNDRYEFVPPR